MLKHEFHALFRAPWRTGLFALLLAAAVAAASLGGGLLAATDKSLTALEEKYTTIAILNAGYFDSISHAALKDSMENSGVAHLDKREIYGGYIEGIHTLTSLEEARMLRKQYREGEVGWEQLGGESFFDEAYKKVILLVTCIKSETETLQADSQKNRSEDACLFQGPFSTYTLQVEQVLSAHEDYAIPAILSYHDILDGETDFLEVGKRYVVQGEIAFDIEPGQEQGSLSIESETYHNEKTGEIESKSKPIFILEGTLEELLAGGSGAEIARRLQECRIANQSIDVITTECTNSILQFNRGDLYVVEGRNFTKKEHAAAAQVCLMSQKLALKNGISVGDTVAIDMYRTSFVTWDLNWARIPFSSYWGNELLGKKIYKIIGLFNTPEWDSTYMKMSLSPNTVIVPADIQNGEVGYLPKAMYAAIVQNGHGEDFLAEMEALEPGSSNNFVIYDQGYSEVAPAMEAFAKNARLVAAGCAAVFALAGGMFLALARAKHRHDLGVMRSLGAAKQKAFFAFLVRCTVPVLFGGVLGCAAAQLLFGRAAALLGEEGLVAQPVGAMWIIALGCALALTGLAAAAGAGLVKKKPQELMREGKE